MRSELQGVHRSSSLSCHVRTRTRPRLSQARVMAISRSDARTTLTHSSGPLTASGRRASAAGISWTSVGAPTLGWNFTRQNGTRGLYTSRASSAAVNPDQSGYRQVGRLLPHRRHIVEFDARTRPSWPGRRQIRQHRPARRGSTREPRRPRWRSGEPPFQLARSRTEGAWVSTTPVAPLRIL